MLAAWSPAGPAEAPDRPGRDRHRHRPDPERAGRLVVRKPCGRASAWSTGASTSTPRRPSPTASCPRRLAGPRPATPAAAGLRLVRSRCRPGCLHAATAWSQYGHAARKVTLVPWALVEPGSAGAAGAGGPSRAVRRRAALGLLYSGNFGRAHSFAEFLDLARRLRGSGVQFCFGVRGNRAEELRAAVQPDDTNVRLAGFAPGGGAWPSGWPRRTSTW